MANTTMGSHSRRTLFMKIVLAVCAVLAAAWALEAMVGWRSSVLPLLGLQPLQRGVHQHSSAQHHAAMLQSATGAQPSSNIQDSKEAARIAAAPAAPAPNYKAPLVLGSKEGKPAAAIMLLHGLGDSQEGISGLARELLAHPGMGNVRVVIPEAPKRPSTVNGGRVMNAWYDIVTFNPIDENEDEKALKESARHVASLIWNYELMGVSPHQVAVVGYSQGGAIALLLLRRSEIRYGAVIALSTYMPLRNQPPVLSKINLPTPILMCHGDADNVVGYQFGTKTYEQLKEAGATITFKTYEGVRHSLIPDEVRLVGQFIKDKVLSNGM